MLKYVTIFLVVLIELSRNLYGEKGQPKEELTKEDLVKFEEKLEELREELELLKSKVDKGATEEEIKEVREKISALSRQIAQLEEVIITQKNRMAEFEKRTQRLEKGVKVEYNWGEGFKVKGEEFVFGIFGYVRSGYHGFIGGDKKVSEFNVLNSRIQISASFVERLDLVLYQELIGEAPKLMDAYIGLKLFSWLNFKAGQFKVGFDREYLTKDTVLPFYARDITTSRYSYARDIGIQVEGKLPKNFTYWLGVFNGSGINKENDNYDFLYTLRLQYEPFGRRENLWTFFKDKEKIYLSFGVGGGFNLVKTKWSEDFYYNTAVYRGTVDLFLSFFGVNLGGVIFIEYRDPGAAASSNLNMGGFLHVGYMVIDSLMELMFRVNSIDPDLRHKGDYGMRYLGGINLYLKENSFKVQLSYSYSDNIESKYKGEKIKGHEIMLQAQLTL